MTAKALVLAVCLTGCATLFGGGPDNVPLASEPTGAMIRVNGAVVGKTPMVLGLDRGSPAMIEVSLDGYAPKTFGLKKSLNGWFIANIFWFYLIVPFVVDVIDGNWQSYDDDTIVVKLAPLGAS